MRTTVTLDPDAEQIVRRRMRERGLSFKEAINDAIRSAVMTAGPGEPFRTDVAALGDSHANLDRALQLATDIEDDELIRKMRSAS